MGQLKVEGNNLYIGKDHGWFAEVNDPGEVVERPDDWEHMVEISYAPVLKQQGP